jgi:hypothetical protein
MRQLLFLVPALITAGCATVAPRDHVGWHVSADLGAGSSRSEVSSGGSSQSMSGGGATFAVAVGGAVTPNLIVGAQVWGTAVPDPRLEDDLGSGTAENFTYGAYGVGPMVKYYAMPLNLYVAVTPSLTRLSLRDQDGNGGETDLGLGLRAAVGKEWTVADRWGLGLAGVLDLASNKDKGAGGPTWKTVAAGIVFSASMN